MQTDIQIVIDNPPFVIPDEYRQRLQEALQVTWYGRKVFTGIHAYSGDHEVCHRIKVYARAVFGTLFYGAGVYFSFYGSWKMAQTMFSTGLIQADIGHVGEWPLQIFECGLGICMFLHAFSNRGCLEEVKKIYRDVIAHLVDENQELDISDFYQQLENDILYLANRSFSDTNLLEIRTFLVELFDGVDIDVFSCPSLELDCDLVDDYREILNRIKESQSWSLSNTREFLSDGIELLGRRGVGQAVSKGIGVTVFQTGILTCSVFLVWGFINVINESYISKTSPESSGHLFGWSFDILANLFLIYTVYSWTIKREAVLHRTQRIMQQYLQPQDEEAGRVPYNQEQVERLCDTCNHLLDRLAMKCNFSTLPSQYRLNPNHV